MKNLEKRFDEEFGDLNDYISFDRNGDITIDTDCISQDIKIFINQEIERIVKGIIWDKEECYNTFDYEPDCGNCRSCYLNIKREQIIDWAKEQGINIKNL